MLANDGDVGLAQSVMEAPSAIYRQLARFPERG